MLFHSEEELIKSIRHAIENQELKAFYQPKYNALTSVLQGAEALVRWVKPDGKIIPPMEFIPILEKSNAILELDWYMLKNVCTYLKRAKQLDIPIVQISINFSRMHFIYEDDLVRRICDMADSFEIEHDLIEIEITESAFIESPELIIAKIVDMRKRGFCVAIDDFGSGFSSLGIVKDVVFDTLKIDKALISHNCDNERERTVLESIFTCASRLKLNTVAEGVETNEQLDFMRACNCKTIQGYLFSKPISEIDFEIACQMQTGEHSVEDILKTQAQSSAIQLLLDALFMKFPLVIYQNLTRNSFYSMAYEHFSSTNGPSIGSFQELHEHGIASMHPDDREVFKNTFDREHLLNLYEQGEKSVELITRQLGNDGVYRLVETTAYFVKNPAAKDILMITFAQNI